MATTPAFISPAPRPYIRPSRHLEAWAGVGRRRRLPRTQDADHVIKYRILHATLSLFEGGIYRHD